MMTPPMELSKTRLDSDLFKTNRALEATRRLEMMAPTIGEQPAPPHSHACQHTRIQQESPSACSCRETCGPISAILLTESSMIYMAGLKLRPGSRASARGPPARRSRRSP